VALIPLSLLYPGFAVPSIFRMVCFAVRGFFYSSNPDHEFTHVPIVLKSLYKGICSGKPVSFLLFSPEVQGG